MINLFKHIINNTTSFHIKETINNQSNFFIYKEQYNNSSIFARVTIYNDEIEIFFHNKTIDHNKLINILSDELNDNFYLALEFFNTSTKNIIIQSKNNNNIVIIKQTIDKLILKKL